MVPTNDSMSERKMQLLYFHDSQPKSGRDLALPTLSFCPTMKRLARIVKGDSKSY